LDLEGEVFYLFFMSPTATLEGYGVEANLLDALCTASLANYFLVLLGYGKEYIYGVFALNAGELIVRNFSRLLRRYRWRNGEAS
jgi:hypothetical protein